MKYSFSRIINAALIVGSLDLLAACIYYYLRTGNGPENILRYIASGVMGSDAFSGHPAMMGLGLLFHYLIALVFTITFFGLFARFRTFRIHPLPAGLVYGISVWAVMNLIVVPLSRVKAPALEPLQAVINFLILALCIGLPLAYLARREERR